MVAVKECSPNKPTTHLWKVPCNDELNFGSRCPIECAPGYWMKAGDSMVAECKVDANGDMKWTIESCISERHGARYLQSRCVTYRDTGVTIRYVARYFVDAQTNRLSGSKIEEA